MRYLLPSIALSSAAVAAAVDNPRYDRSELDFEHKRLRHELKNRHLEALMVTETNSITQGQVTSDQLQLIQTIITELSLATLPDGVDLTKVNVAVIVTVALQELGYIDATVEDLSKADMAIIIQEIIEKAAKILGVVTTTTTITPSSETSSTSSYVTTTTGATTSPPCVCSPFSYTFTINFSRNCDTDTFNGNPGIGNILCQMLGINDVDVDLNTFKVFDVQFLEVDTSGNLTVINQDDTYNNVSLSDGDTVSFHSVSANLNPNVPLSSQLNDVPGGILLSLRAKSDESSTIVTNRVSWMYTNSCASLPTNVGDTIGWITLSDKKDTSRAFCPVAAIPTTAPTPLPTKKPTFAPVDASDSPTSSPTKKPTIAPISDPTPILAPVTPTPTKAKTTSTSSPTRFGKAAKSKSSKSDHMAKAIKEADATMPVSAKQKIASKYSSDIISKGDKSQKGVSPSTEKQPKLSTSSTKGDKSSVGKSGKTSVIAETKAYKIMSKGT